ncbi:MAG: sugar phosphorylase [Anaerolinea sp.]|nr:sugar phosphorylase [Anaerolinea sp.]
MTPSDRIRVLLTELYPDHADVLFRTIGERLRKVYVPPAQGDYFSEKTITLITYGDSLRRADEAPLRILHGFLNSHINGEIDTVHLLPFYPYSSDDGFSVIDYYAVNPELGRWDDVQALSDDYRLMFDAVINHMSAKSEWFARFLADDPDFAHLFMTEHPENDLSAVVRPRTSPLLTAFTKPDGRTVHVWTTFSDDQVDLDYRAPSTFLRILDVLLFYVEQGAQVIRLDAIAFMWKIAGTTSLHLPQTHAVIKLFRAVLDVIAPHVILITETNVPHAENISYLGADEAQLVYNFTLPPLLLHTLITGKAVKLAAWINSLPAPTPRTTFFNFTASHDGIGVRPVEGILSANDLADMIAHVEANGGRVSYRSLPDGSKKPYELNITYVDAAGKPGISPDEHVKRFLLTQAVMLALAGVPAIYIHSLLGTRNDAEGVDRLGYNRAINRAKLDADALQAELGTDGTFRNRVFSGYKRLLAERRAGSAFHPLGDQRAFTLNGGVVLGVDRRSPDGAERVICLFNFGDRAETVMHAAVGTVELRPYEWRWIATASDPVR